MNITPQQISNLKPNEIFVFGSNLQGNHAGGAARFAVLKFGAEMGNPIGLQGQSYAIPTLSQAAIGIPLDKLKLPISEIGKYVNEFIGFASQHPDMFFYVTPIGCGIAGFTEEEIAPLFSKCVNMENVALPETFFSVLGVQDEIDNETLNDNMMENKKVIKLSEAQLHRVIKESVNRILQEYGDTPKGQAVLGALQQRKLQQGREAQQMYGTFAKEPDKYYQSAKDIDNYAWNQRGGRDASRDMTNAYYRGEDAQHSYYHHGIDKNTRNNVINNNSWDNN